MSIVTPALMLSAAPLAIFVEPPVPDIEPPLQFITPFTVSALLPPSVPPETLSVLRLFSVTGAFTASAELVITPLTAPLLTLTDINSVAHTTTLQWEATPGTAYEIRYATDLGAADWQVLTNFISTGTVAGWQDNSQFSSNAPLTPAAAKRFYRVRSLY